MRFKKIYIEITNKCNLNCAFCAHSGDNGNFMSAGQFSDILLKIKNYTSLIALHVLGEPLLHPELLAILKICSRESVQVNITTNGVLLKTVDPEIFSEPSLRQLNISLHSMGGHSSLDKAGQYARNMVSAGKLMADRFPVIVSFRLWNLTTENKETVVFNKQVIHIINSHFKQNILLSDIEDRNRGVKIAERVYLNSDHRFSWPDPRRSSYGETGTCYGLRDQIAILNNGTVVPCCLDYQGHLALGNIYHQTLDEILNVPMATKMVTGFSRRKIVMDLCRSCEYRLRFGH